jgi:serine/threonine protein kinase
VFKQSPNSSLYLPWRYLGKGTFGCTVEVLAKAKKEERYVQKVVNTFHLAEDYLFLNQSLFRELNSSVNFIHVRAIKMEGGKMYILMQRFGGGDLYSFMKRNAKEIDEGFVRELTVSVVLVLEKIHAKGVIYRNLRPENILFVNGDGVFEFSELLFAIGGERCTSYYGAATYTAP